MSEHDLYLVYTIDDDGIHLWCRYCDRKHPLGYEPTPTDVDRAVHNHLEERYE